MVTSCAHHVCLKLKNEKCPYCSLQIGHIHCRAIGKVLESLQVPCRYKKYGCKETMACSDIHKHMKKLCKYAPCSCPVHRSKFVGPSMKVKMHCTTNHAGAGLITHFSHNRMFSVSIHIDKDIIVLQECITPTVFVLHNRSDPGENDFFLSRIGPSCCKTGLSYDLITRDEIGSISLQSQTEVDQGMVSDFLSKKVLMVPKSAFGDSKKIKLELCIWAMKRKL